MNIRRFVASDMREALAAIRADLGVDAVMLSTRKLPEGVEGYTTFPDGTVVVCPVRLTLGAVVLHEMGHSLSGRGDHIRSGVMQAVTYEGMERAEPTWADAEYVLKGNER